MGFRLAIKIVIAQTIAFVISHGEAERKMPATGCDQVDMPAGGYPTKISNAPKCYTNKDFQFNI
jgi:hypothetical protein